MKGLQSVIGLSIAHPVFQKTKPSDELDKHEGWTFREYIIPKILISTLNRVFKTAPLIRQLHPLLVTAQFRALDVSLTLSTEFDLSVISMSSSETRNTFDIIFDDKRCYLAR